LPNPPNPALPPQSAQDRVWNHLTQQFAADHLAACLFWTPHVAHLWHGTVLADPAALEVRISGEPQAGFFPAEATVLIGGESVLLQGVSTAAGAGQLAVLGQLRQGHSGVMADVARRIAQLLQIAQETDAQVDAQSHQLSEQQAIVDHITDGLLVVDRDGVVKHLNAAAGRILSLIPSQSVGRRFSELLDFEPIIAPILASGVGYQDRELIIDSPRRHLHLIDTAVPIKDRHGRVLSIVNSFREIQRVRRVADKFNGSHARYTFSDLVGQSEALGRAVDAAKKAARGFANVMLLGESGVGKEVFAQAIHNASERVEGPFVAINCAALPRDLIESELFGYASGSFTGARKEGRPGKFEAASGGTIFLDELSELPIDVQAKLLRVLQEREVVRVGESRGIPIDVRLISASNRDLRAMARLREFREDLYYRCNVIGINIPALRDRPTDIPVLTNYFVSKYAGLLKRNVFGFSADALARLQDYNWPGNVRELENTIERIVNLTEHDVIQLGDLPDELQGFRPVASGAPAVRAVVPRSLHELEREAIVSMLTWCSFNVTDAARRLGISKPTLYSKVREHGITLERGPRLE
jgi:sigma-54 dependent transcriptional regulator, acetoin dehydrogenase operon transcriptional activator AcoR